MPPTNACTHALSSKSPQVTTRAINTFKSSPAKALLNQFPSLPATKIAPSVMLNPAQTSSGPTTPMLEGDPVGPAYAVSPTVQNVWYCNNGKTPKKAGLIAASITIDSADEFSHPQGASIPMAGVPKAMTSAYKELKTSAESVKFA